MRPFSQKPSLGLGQLVGLLTCKCNFLSGTCLDILCRIDENWETLTCALQTHGPTSTTLDTGLMAISLQRLLWVWNCTLLSLLVVSFLPCMCVCVCLFQSDLSLPWQLRGGLSMRVSFDQQRGSCMISHWLQAFTLTGIKRLNHHWSNTHLIREARCHFALTRCTLLWSGCWKLKVQSSAAPERSVMFIRRISSSAVMELKFFRFQFVPERFQDVHFYLLANEDNVMWSKSSANKCTSRWDCFVNCRFQLKLNKKN